jgi:hypothetical protein
MSNLLAVTELGQSGSRRQLTWRKYRAASERGVTTRALTSCLVIAGVCGLFSPTANGQTFGCNPALANDIVCENSKPGSPPTEWDVSTGDAGDPTIQGFGADISVNQGGTISFKINTDAIAYTIDIYRLGYYGGNGARKIASISPSARLPQSQPACLTDSTTNLVDCGNWAISASWQVPSNATSGIYIAHLIRTDTGGDSHIVFIVRNDASHSAIFLQASDETWQAYNAYGGNSLYGGADTFDISDRAYKVSYNRPFITRGFEFESATWVFGTEYPMMRWLEANGYDITYTTGIDAVRNGNLILNHKVYISSGHDEYWSGPQRTNVQAAQNAGVNMAFFSGNEVYQKTRWENSIDGTNTPYRTLVCYKESYANAPIDPDDPPTWTGTWRDPRFSPPADGGQPENALTGSLWMVSGIGADNPGTFSIQVPYADGQMRFWRNTSVAKLSPGQTATLPPGTLGYEWDEDVDNGFRPAGTFDLSTATYTLTSDLLLDYGATTGAGVATHHMTLHRLPSGALIFGAGTIQWSWGLDSNHDNPFEENQPPDPDMQQATVNLLADMGVQPATLQSGLVLATASTDTTPPTSTISSPVANANIRVGTTITITGTAVDTGGGVVGGVEVSVDGGTTWHPALGRASWSYSWTPAELGSVKILSRAVDDSGNLEAPSGGVQVNVAASDCPCDAWNSSTAPTNVDSGDPTSVEVGVKFRTDYNGYITGIRFYKATANTGTHVGNLWSSTGVLLGSATFTNETSSGWQQVSFSTPVAIQANTTYIASYHAPNGHYSADLHFFQSAGVDEPPVHLLANGVDGSNGVFSVGAASSFPNLTYEAANYWVDVVFIPATSMPGAPPALLATPLSLNFAGSVGGSIPAQQVTIYDEGTGTLNWTASSSASWLVLNPSSGTTPQTISVSVNGTGLAGGTYTGTITISAPSATNQPQTIPVTLTLTNTLLFSNFADGTLQGWAFSPLGLASNWSVVNQSLRYNGNGHTQVYAGNSAWTNYTLNVAIKLATLSDYPGGIRGRVNPSTGAGYAVWLYPTEGVIRLYKNVAWDIDDGFTLLGQGSAVFDDVNYHNVQLSFSGSQIQVSYDGHLIITATDSTSTNGMVALDTSNQVINFTNILVTSNTANTGTITASSSSLSFAAVYGGPNPASQTVQLTAGGGGILAWTALSNQPWLSVSSVSGSTPATLQVSVNQASLGGGTFSGVINLVSLGAVNSPLQIPVSLTVTVPPPAIAPSPSSMSFVAKIGQAAPPSQTLSVFNASLGAFSWTASSDSSWLAVSPSSGSTPGTFSVNVNPNGLSVGSYSGNVVISAPGISNSPVSVPVNLQVFYQDMTETFSDQGNGWIISPMGNASGWTVSNGVYSYSGIGLSQSCAGNPSWNNYTFDTYIELSNLSNWPGGVRARVNPSTGAGYLVWVYPGTGEIMLYSTPQWNVTGSGVTLLAQAPLTFDTSLHDLRASLQGNSISVFWDGRLLISTTDSTYSSGFICMDGANQPISYSNITVAGTQTPASLSVSAASLVFSALSGVTPASQQVTVSSKGGTTSWSVVSSQPWLTASASTTLTPGVITAAVNTTGLAVGSYSGTLTVYAPGVANSPISIPVTLAVNASALSLAPASFTFFGAIGLNPAPKSLQITNAGAGALSWTASNTSTWLSLSPTSGSAPSTVSVAASTSGLAVGSYSDTITVTAPGAGNSPANVPVSLWVGNLLFSDNFSAGAGNWTISPLGNAASWSVSNGVYTFDGTGPSESYAGSSSWADYTFATEFQLSSLNDYPGGIRGRVNTSTGASYGAWIYPTEGVIKLYRIDQWYIDTSFALLGQSAQLKMDTNIHTIRLSFQGPVIEVYYDDNLVISATDSTYTQGAVAFDVSNRPISFQNVTVISLP